MLVRDIKSLNQEELKRETLGHSIGVNYTELTKARRKDGERGISNLGVSATKECEFGLGVKPNSPVLMGDAVERF